MTDAEHNSTEQEVREQVSRNEVSFTKLQKAVYTVLLATFFFCAATIIVWMFEPPPTREYKRQLLTKQVYPGGEVKVQVSVEWTKTCYSRLRRNIVYSNGVLVPFEREIRKNMVGRREFVITQQIPLDAPPGPARWVVITDWFCNPLQYFSPRSVTLDPLEFIILPPKGNSNEGQLQEVPKAGTCVGRRLCQPSQRPRWANQQRRYTESI